MKISTAALPFLILAAALGPPVHASLLRGNSARGVQHRGDCCFFYIRRIECGSVEDYFLTSSKCSRPAVIFIIKWGLGICGDPEDPAVKDCMEDVDTEKKRRKLLAEEKLQ